MFSSKKSRGKPEIPGGSLNLIGNGTLIKGNIETSGDIRIDGTLIGILSGQLRVVLGESAVIEGDISCKDADISGTVLGNLHIDGMLCLKSTARIEGEIITRKLVVEAGAVFSGNCQMKYGNETREVGPERFAEASQ